ncbi:MAG: type II secretion system F family protein [Bifidobacterium pseudocatenulatum]
MMVQMVAIGEDSGAIDQMLASAGKAYDEEAQSMAKQLTSLLEPLMILVLGSVVGFMVVALYADVLHVRRHQRASVSESGKVEHEERIVGRTQPQVSCQIMPTHGEGRGHDARGTVRNGGAHHVGTGNDHTDFASIAVQE